MKKLKLINSIMVASAIATPISFLSSCSEDNYAELAQMIKDDQVMIFKQLSKYHRATFDEGEAFQFIKDEFADKDTYGAEKKGEDKWSSLQCVVDQGNKDIEYIERFSATHPFGNIWYDIQPTKGYENKPKILLHSHVDMTMAWNPEVDIEENRWMDPAEPKKGESQGGVVVNDQDYIEKGFLTSDHETSLGADNGMGVALMMSLAKHRHDFKHPGIRLLFTADESGAVPYFSSKGDEDPTPGQEVNPNDVTDEMLASGADLLTFDQQGGKFQEVRLGQDGKYRWQAENDTLTSDTIDKPFGDNLEYGNIISFDGSTWNTIYNSAAGIHECQIANTFEADKTLPEYLSDKPVVETLESAQGELEGLKIYKLTVQGLHGGHSGYDINKGYGNALQMLMQTLTTDDEKFRLISVESGDSAYQICKQATATFLISADRDSDIKKRVSTFLEIYSSTYSEEAAKMEFKLDDTIPMPSSVQCFTHERSNQVVLFSDLLIYGPNTWFDKEHTEVKSSCNFGPLTIKQDEVNKTASFNYNIVARSAKEDELDVFQNLFHAAVEQILYDIIDVNDKSQFVHIEDLVWEKNDKVENNVAEQIENGYRNIHIKPSTVSSHAWLEIACFPRLFKDKVQGPDMICYGPEIEAAHTIDEVINTDTVETMIKAVLYTFNHADRLKSYSN